MPKTEITTDSTKNSNPRPAFKTLIEKEKTFYVVEKVVGQKDQPIETHFAVSLYNQEPQDDTIEPDEHIFHLFRRHTSEDYEKDNKVQRLQRKGEC